MMAKKTVPRGKLIGPFKEVVTMEKLSSGGRARDDELTLYQNVYLRFEAGKIAGIGKEEDLKESFDELFILEKDAVALPGLIDADTHLCFAGKCSKDFALRLRGNSLGQEESCIFEIMRKTRAASLLELIELFLPRTHALVKQGVTTAEVKSGYGLSVEDELKILEAVKRAQSKTPLQIVTTCFAANIRPPEYSTDDEYLRDLTAKLLPPILERDLSQKVGLLAGAQEFTTVGFKAEDAKRYLSVAKNLGFAITLDADQFEPGGAKIAADLKALSVAHLEKTSKDDLLALKQAGVTPIALPGDSFGLGTCFANARAMLDIGLPVVIASGLNPCSAPMGQLLCQASIFAMKEKMTIAETLAAITCRAAQGLGLQDRGTIKKGQRADVIVFETDDHKDILAAQGSLLPSYVFIGGERVI